MNTYISKPITVEATKFNGKNKDEVFELIGKRRTFVSLNGKNDNLIVETETGSEVVHRGEYVVKYADGSVRVLTPELFEKTFVKEEVMAQSKK